MQNINHTLFDSNMTGKTKEIAALFNNFKVYLRGKCFDLPRNKLVTSTKKGKNS